MRVRPQFTNGEFYHVYNRGTEKRNIFTSPTDGLRFLDSMRSFNRAEPIGSLYLLNFENGDKKKGVPLVDIIAYCLNPNHFHMIIRQRKERGVSEFMKRLSGGYTCFFNEKYKRTGSLFAGSYKIKHIKDNDYLLHLSAYVNLNNKVHGINTPVKSSWAEYNSGQSNICTTSPILEQFKNPADYANFAVGSLELMLERKKSDSELSSHLLED